jgi:hypothetical protein
MCEKCQELENRVYELTQAMNSVNEHLSRWQDEMIDNVRRTEREHDAEVRKLKHKIRTLQDQVRFKGIGRCRSSFWSALRGHEKEEGWL